MGEQQHLLGDAERPRLQQNGLPCIVVTSNVSSEINMQRGKYKTELRPAFWPGHHESFHVAVTQTHMDSLLLLWGLSRICRSSVGFVSVVCNSTIFSSFNCNLQRPCRLKMHISMLRCISAFTKVPFYLQCCTEMNCCSSYAETVSFRG